jgi:hypothetical protein
LSRSRSKRIRWNWIRRVCQKDERLTPNVRDAIAESVIKDFGALKQTKVDFAAKLVQIVSVGRGRDVGGVEQGESQRLGVNPVLSG